MVVLKEKMELDEGQAYEVSERKCGYDELRFKNSDKEVILCTFYF